MGQITATRNLVATKVVRLAGQQESTSMADWRRKAMEILAVCGVAPSCMKMGRSPYTPCLRHLHCLANVRYCIPRCFHPNDLSSLADGTFPHDEVKLTSHKKLTFWVAKVVLVSTLLFKDYMINFTHFCQTCYQVYTDHIDNFSGSHSMSNTMKNKFGNFCKNFFPGV